MSRDIIETTLGDLIVALTEEASQVVHHKQEIYKVVSYMLNDLLLKRSVRFKSQPVEAEKQWETSLICS